MLIIFDGIILDIKANKNMKPIVAKVFMKGRKLNISVVFISQSYFKVPKEKTKHGTLFYHENTNNVESCVWCRV